MTEDNKKHGHYHGDSPLDDPSEDRFSRWPFAERVAHTIAHRNDPSNIVIGIYGAWGEGKTTVINYMHHALKSSDNIVVTTFNPWLFRGEEELLFSFFKTIADALGRKLQHKKEEIGEAIGKYASLLSPVPSGLYDGAKDIATALSTVDIYEYRNRIEKILAEEGKRLVVFIDDIDRLDKSEIQAIFRLVKLAADFKNIAYVLAFDAEMVAAALNEKYASEEDHAGYRFLDKIIQVPLNLPPAPHSILETICTEGIDEALKVAELTVKDSDVQEFWRAFRTGISPRMSTPRAVKRYVNAITFALPIMKGEVNPIELIIIEGIRVFYPKLYQHIYQNREAYLCESLGGHSYNSSNESERLEKIREDGQKGLNGDSKIAVKNLIEILFPRTQNMTYGYDWNTTWDKEQRITSSNYFDRYFSYAVPMSDVSDQELSTFIAGIESYSADELIEKLKLMLEGQEATLIRKLRGITDDFTEGQSTLLALALAKLGDLLPNPTQFESWLTPFSQAAMLISQLAKKAPKEHLYEFCSGIIKTASPSLFAAECLRWLRSGKDVSPDERLLPKAQENKLGKELSARLKNEASIEPFYLSMSEHSPQLFAMWKRGSSKKETTKYLRSRFKSNPEEAVKFLLTYVTTAYSMEDGTSHKSDMDRNNFDSIDYVFDPRVLDRFLKEIYGEENLKTNDFPRLVTGDGMELTVARQFCYLHLYVQEEKKKKKEEAEKNDS